MLCGTPLSPPTVVTTTGMRVHRACADRVATQAWRQRWLAALIHGLLILGTGVGLTLRGVDAPLLLAVVVAWLALHSRLHTRVWHYLARDLGRWLRGR